MKKIAFISTLFLFSCMSKPTDLTEADKKIISTEVEKVLKEYFADVKSNGMMAEFKYLDSTDQFFWSPPGYDHAINYDSVKIAITNTTPGFTTVDNTWTTLMIQPLTKDHALYNGKIHSVMVDTAGKRSEVDLIETGIVIKRNTGWKLLSGQTTFLTN